MHPLFVCIVWCFKQIHTSLTVKLIKQTNSKNNFTFLTNLIHENQFTSGPTKKLWDMNILVREVSFQITTCRFKMISKNEVSYSATPYHDKGYSKHSNIVWKYSFTFALLYKQYWGNEFYIWDEMFKIAYDKNNNACMQLQTS